MYMGLGLAIAFINVAGCNVVKRRLQIPRKGGLELIVLCLSGL